MKKKTICMIVQDPFVKGGIASVVNGYKGSKLEEDFDIKYVESYKNGNKLEKLIKAFNGIIKFIKILIVDKPSVIHIHSSFGASFYRKIPFIYISHLLNKKIINHIHGANFEEFYDNAPNYKKRMIQNSYNKCNYLIALSEEWKVKLNKIVSEDKIVVIENYSILNKEAILEREKKDNNNQVLFLGELGERKGCYDIPEVVKAVSDVIPNVKFILCGDGEQEKIKNKLREYNIESKVEFPGWVRGNEKDKIMKESDILFLPSYNEGMPMAILDSMGYGLPIVSTTVGGIPKIVKNGINGYIYEPGDTVNFSKSIIHLLLNYNECKLFGEKSFKIVNDRYSLEKHIYLLEKLYY